MTSWLSIKWLRVALLLLLVGVVSWFLGYHQFSDFLPTFWEYAIMVFVPGVFYLLMESLRMRFRMHGLYAESVTIFAALMLGSFCVFFAVQIQLVYAIAFFSGYFILGSFLSLVYYIANVFRDLEWKMGQPSNVQPKFESDTGEATPQFTLTNPKGRTVFNIPFEDLICFEANDNYINIYFLTANGVQKRMERLSMKKVEGLIEPHEHDFLRVHKSYLVNRQKVEAIQGKAQNYRLVLSQLNFQVPVSRRMAIHDYFPSI